MKHLLNYSVYQDLGELGPDLHSLLKDIRCDGLEMLTSHSPADPALKEYTVSVHLPYATDWMAAWNDEPYEMDPSYTKYYMYGTDHDSVISTITDMINYAAPLEPAHGVIHACNVSMKELYKRNYSGDSKRILETLCEVMNTAVDIAVEVGVSKGDGIEHLLRLLARSSVIKVGERPVMNRLT